MRLLLGLCCLLLLACNQQGDQPGTAARSTEQDEQMIRGLIPSLNEGMTKDIYYITPWGWSEPLDSTKSRIRRASAMLRDYDNRIENLEVKVYGDGAYASYIFRQNSMINDMMLEEYLPTTVILERRGEGWNIVRMHRSTDYETFQQYVAMQQQRQAGR